MNKFMKTTALVLALSLCTAVTSSCSSKIKLNPKNPVTISIWHYYNGVVMNSFNDLIKEFNESVGLKEGIIVESSGMGNVSELEAAVIASANKEVGSQDMPNIFASYADTAYEAEKLGLLADLGKYFNKSEQSKYIDSYIEEGKIGLNGELKIFPIAKSTEIFMLNKTDWEPFAKEYSLTYDDLSTKEKLAKTASLYYEYTDNKTPNIPEDGKAFFGRDAFANLMVVGSKELGTEIFKAENGKAEINVNKEIMRKIWDFYYLSYINGYFTSYGRYRSDDAKVGLLVSYVGSTSSASYFPSEVTADSGTYSIEPVVLPVPSFETASKKVMVQQGAGMVVTKSTPEEEYASTVFLKWFTDIDSNVRFSAQSGYMPVKKDANDFSTFMNIAATNSITLGDVNEKTLEVSFTHMKESEMYTNKAFEGGANARKILEYSLPDKAAADRDSVTALIAGGMSRKDAVARFDTDENFEAWYKELVEKLNNL